MLSRDRTGPIHGPITCQQDFDLRAGQKVYLGGLYRVVDGLLTVPADETAQDGCITVMALHHRSNQNGQDRARRARCVVDGIALIPIGDLVKSHIGKPVYPNSNDAITASAPNNAGNQPAGTLLAVEGTHAKVKLG